MIMRSHRIGLNKPNLYFGGGHYDRCYGSVCIRRVVGVKQLGIGIAAALLIDATVIRMVLVSALMKLFGK
jgi:hypothetical protein